MTRFLIIDALIVIVVSGGGWAFYKAITKRREARTLKHEGYFSGGPLHDKTMKFAKLPETYQYTFERPIAVKVTEGGDPEPQTTSAYWNAIYEHQGGGTYAYRGSVQVDKLMQYDVEDDE